MLVAEPSWERRQSPSRTISEEPDLSRVPDEPPFKAFVTNICYDAQREDLKDHFGPDVSSFIPCGDPIINMAN